MVIERYDGWVDGSSVDCYFECVFDCEVVVNFCVCEWIVYMLFLYMIFWNVVWYFCVVDIEIVLVKILFDCEIGEIFVCWSWLDVLVYGL